MRSAVGMASAGAITRRDLDQGALDSRGIAIRAGDLAALPRLKRFEVASAARLSCSQYTQTEDIDRLCAALHQLTRTEASA